MMSAFRMSSRPELERTGIKPRGEEVATSKAKRVSFKVKMKASSTAIEPRSGGM
jgi:hypothetical protein